MVQPGKYLAKIEDYGFSEKGSAIVSFQTIEGDIIAWFGSFNGGAKEYTIQTLLKLGFRGKTGQELAQGKGSNWLDEGKDFEIVVVQEEYQGKKRNKIKYINIPGHQKELKKMSLDQAKIHVGGLNLAADFASERAKQPNQDIKNYAPSFNDNEGIPF